MKKNEKILLSLATQNYDVHEMLHVLVLFVRRALVSCLDIAIRMGWSVPRQAQGSISFFRYEDIASHEDFHLQGERWSFNENTSSE